MKRALFALNILLIGICILFSSCVDEEDYTNDSSINLKFSTDTIAFDTIFTTIGSITKQLRVYNPEDKPIKLDYVTVGGGSASYYRLNVDGDTSIVAKDVEIGAKDSIFIFIRCELNANNKNNPLLVQDSIVFGFNGKEQYVQLWAYGQDAYYHKPTHTLFSGNSSIPYSLANEGGENSGVSISGNEITWKNDKPHVIIGTLVVDSAYTLNLTDGTQIYMGNAANFWVYKNGSIKAVGSTNSPINFQSIRMQDRYYSIPGQWGQIYLMPGSKDNSLENVNIMNATIGIIVDTCVNSNHTLTMRNVQIKNCANAGLFARGADIYGENVMIQNCGSYCVALAYGGKYEFIGSTFANYWSYDNNRQDATLVLNDWYKTAEGNIQIRPIDKAEFYNCIIYGSLLEDEVELDLYEGNHSSWKFDHCLIKSKALLNYSSTFHGCIMNKDPLFTDASNGDLSLMNNSPAIGAADGVWNNTVGTDIFGTYRLDPPCIGAIENTNRSTK